MSFLYRILSDRIIEALGLTIIHSLWQGALIAMVLGMLMFFTRKFTSVTRYFLSVTALAFMLICPVYTFIKNYNPEPAANNSTYADRLSDTPALKRDITTASENNEIIAEGHTAKLKSVPLKDFFNRHFPLIVTIWFAGIIFFTLKFIGALAYTQRLKYYRISQISEDWQKKTRLLCKKLNIGKAVKIYKSALAKVPMVIGLIKPVILLPVSAFTGLSPKQLESIIAHELAHILRRDYIINLLQSVVEILFFYHPAVWWINNVIRTERENCCDDIAIAQTGDSTDYARALASIQEHLLLNKSLALSAAGNKNKLLKRIKRLLNQPKMKTNFIEGFTASCIILIGIFMIVLNANAITDRNTEPSSQARVISSISGEPDSTVVLDDLQDLEDLENAEEIEEEATEAAEAAEAAEEVEETAEGAAEVEEATAAAAAEAAEAAEEVPPLSPDEITEEIISGIEQGIIEMDLDMIVDEAMAGIQAGLHEMDINAIVREAIRGTNEGIQNADIDLIINEALIGIQAAMENMDLNAIVAEALKGVNKAQIKKEIKAEKRENFYDDDDTDCPTFVGNAEHLALLKMGTSYWNKWRAENAKEKVDLRGACLNEAILTNMNLSDAFLQNINLKEAVLDGTDFSRANLEAANLKEASLSQVVFSETNMNGINLKEVELKNINLSKSILTSANLKEIAMYSVDLSNADLRGANMKEASLKDVDFSKADLRGADLSEAAINGCKFDGVIIDSTTLLPPGFSIDTN
jgi:beta-lactamase regulating signal transducer with metallopeptidase domain